MCQGVTAESSGPRDPITGGTRSAVWSELLLTTHPVFTNRRPLPEERFPRRPRRNDPGGPPEIFVGLVVLRCEREGDQARGTSAWQSSQPVEMQAASDTGAHPSKPRVAGSSPAGRVKFTRGASPLELPYTLACGDPFRPAPLAWLTRCARSHLCPCLSTWPP